MSVADISRFAHAFLIPLGAGPDNSAKRVSQKPNIAGDIGAVIVVDQVTRFLMPEDSFAVSRTARS